MGLSTEEFGRLNHVAEMSGVSVEILGKSIRGLRAPSAEAAGELKRLGVSLTDSTGKGKSAETMLGDIAEKFKNMSAADRATSAVQLFGNKAAEMTNVLADGREGIKSLGDEAEKLGLVFNKEAAENAELFSDNLDRVKLALSGVTQAVGESIIQFVNESHVMEAVTSAISDVTSWIKSLDADTKEIIITAGLVVVGITALVGAFMAISAIAPLVGAALTAMTGPFLPLVLLLGAIAAGVTVVITHWEQFKATMQPVVRLFETLKSTFSQAWDSIAEKLAPLFSKLSSLFASLDTGKLSVIDITIKSIVTGIAIFIYNLNQTILVFKTLGGAVQDFGKLLHAAFIGDLSGIKKNWANLQKNFGQNLNQMSKDANQFANEFKNIWSEQPPVAPPKIDKDKAEKEGNEAGIRASKGFEKGMDSSKGFTQRLQEVDTGSIEKMGNQLGGLLGDGISLALGGEGVLGAIGGALGGILGQAGTIFKSWLDMQFKLWEAEIARYSNEAKKFEFVFMLGTKALEKQHKIQVEQIKSNYDTIIEETQNFYIKKRELEDEEFAVTKAQLESIKQARIAAMLAEVEDQKDIYAQKSVNESDRILGLAQFDLDAKDKQKQIEEEFNQKLIEETQQKSAREVSLKKAEDEKIKLLENQKNAQLEKAEKDHNDALKEEKKKAALTKYFYDNLSLGVQKQMAQVNASLAYAQSIMSSVQAGIQLAATSGPLGFILGPALTALLISMATTGYHATISTIASQFVMPPSELFAADGGFLEGPKHAQGGVHVNAEGGEYIINARSTARHRELLDAINTGTLPDSGGSMIPAKQIIFEAGAIVVEGVYDERVIDMISEQIGDRVLQRV